MNEELIMSLDPSSTKTGYCIMNRSERILEAGILTGKRDSMAEIRIAVMAKELMDLLRHFRPGSIVIEITSGKVNTKRHYGSGAGLSVLGLAIGRLWGQAEAWKLTLSPNESNEVRIVLIRENRWIAGRSKKDRQQAVALAYSKYDPTNDTGYDVSDAICLAQWFLQEQKIKELK